MAVTTVLEVVPMVFFIISVAGNCQKIEYIVYVEISPKSAFGMRIDDYKWYSYVQRFNGRLLPNRAYQVSVATPFHAIKGQGYLNGVMSINIILKNKKSDEIASSSTILLRTGRNRIFLELIYDSLKKKDELPYYGPFGVHPKNCTIIPRNQLMIFTDRIELCQRIFQLQMS